jgi:hypothetical protein
MKKHLGCDFEQTVVKSLKSGFVTDEISEHIRACADCRETAKVMQFFQTNIMNEPLPKSLPAAGLVWWKFQMREKRLHTKRAAQPILIAQTVAAAVALVTIIWLMQNRSSYFSSIESALNRVFASMETIAVPFITGTICFALICTILVLALRRLLPER